MKKLALFIALGLLTACNDGGTPSGAYGRPTDMRPGRNPFVNTAKESNAQITGMISSNATQVASYMDYRLNGYTGTKTPENYADVAELAIKLATMNTDEIENQFTENKDILFQAMYVLNHNLGTCAGDTGAIVAECINTWRNANQGAINASINSLRANGELLSINDAEFISPDASLTFSINESGEIMGITIDNGETQNVFNRNGNIFVNNTETLSYNSGAGSNLVLSYSDFGIYTITNNADTSKITYAPFAGGYASKQIAVANIEKDMTFSGRAVGTASKGDDSINLDGTATLNFKTGDNPTSELMANFDNWYTVNITQAGDAPNANFVFSGNPTETDVILTNTTGTGTMNVGYYGPDGTPTEATGLAQFTESGVENGVKFDMAFGVNNKQ